MLQIKNVKTYEAQTSPARLSDEINRLLKFQLSRFPCFWFREFQSFRRPFIYFYTLLQPNLANSSNIHPILSHSVQFNLIPIPARLCPFQPIPSHPSHFQHFRAISWKPKHLPNMLLISAKFDPCASILLKKTMNVCCRPRQLWPWLFASLLSNKGLDLKKARLSVNNKS